MKKLALVLLLLLLAVSGCGKTYDNPEALLPLVREEIPVANADTIEIQYAGMSTRNDRALLWYLSGNEYQAHTYFVVDCEITENGQYRYRRAWDISERAEDIAREEWCGGYSFCINNPQCKILRITDNSGTREIEIDAYPFVYYNKLLVVEYAFLDETGNELK